MFFLKNIERARFFVECIFSERNSEKIDLVICKNFWTNKNQQIGLNQNQSRGAMEIHSAWNFKKNSKMSHIKMGTYRNWHRNPGNQGATFHWGLLFFKKRELLKQHKLAYVRERIKEQRCNFNKWSWTKDFEFMP